MNLGMPEMLFIFFIALLMFGPKKLPQIGREIGKFMAEFKRASNEFKYQLESEIQQLEYEEKQKDAATTRDETATTIAEIESQESTFTIRPPQQPSVPSTLGESAGLSTDSSEHAAEEPASEAATVSPVISEIPAGETAADKGSNA